MKIVIWMKIKEKRTGEETFRPFTVDAQPVEIPGFLWCDAVAHHRVSFDEKTGAFEIDEERWVIAEPTTGCILMYPDRDCPESIEQALAESSAFMREKKANPASLARAIEINLARLPEGRPPSPQLEEEQPPQSDPILRARAKTQIKTSARRAGKTDAQRRSKR